MTSDALYEELVGRIGMPMGNGGPSFAPDPVNLPMIRHWVDAFDDRNPVYLDADAAVAAGFPGIVAPPAMLQTWTMARPRIEGIRERGGAPTEVDGDSPVSLLTDAGFPATLATNSELEFDRYLHVGEELVAESALDTVSERKGTGIGVGYFVTWVTTYRTATGEEVGRQRFRILKFDPTRSADEVPRAPKPANADTAAATPPREKVAGEELPTFDLEVSPTVVVAGAIASRDFMPVHHDRDYARAQGAPDLFMNILTTTGYLVRYVTDWAGPRARVRRIALRLGAPSTPGRILRFTGAVTDQHVDGGTRHVEVTLRAANDLGDHATGTLDLTLPI